MCDDRYHDLNIFLDHNKAIDSINDLRFLAAELRRAAASQKPAVENIGAACLGNGDFGKAVGEMLQRTQNAYKGVLDVAARLDEIASKISESAEALQMRKKSS